LRWFTQNFPRSAPVASFLLLYGWFMGYLGCSMTKPPFETRMNGETSLRNKAVRAASYRFYGKNGVLGPQYQSVNEKMLRWHKIQNF